MAAGRNCTLVMEDVFKLTVATTVKYNQELNIGTNIRISEGHAVGDSTGSTMSSPPPQEILWMS